MVVRKRICILGMTIFFASIVANGGPLDPDCDAKKAGKSAAMKATVGVGGRCSPKEAATDTAKDAVGVENKGPIEKRKKEDEGVAKKGLKKAIN